MNIFSCCCPAVCTTIAQLLINLCTIKGAVNKKMKLGHEAKVLGAVEVFGAFDLAAGPHV